ncbi:crosslink repair DNA glycosylase YcaQ family protein [Tropicimonas sp. TH_r6]|uniref:winged helix-turn-helix domain-containing protein n=1 Tax=Tropicimonas sp. TH_r6 TaxID=3082085 RepID=UPI0029531F1C|nr:crosslink repair DNA glycosylase YcaQ family protein [Tropicimonas sp. TH_r6]MDV7144826.1 crosslink repair DNA glycosylase YcaQ family protein [Tropicimonas sp. TH_r6]
MPQTNAPALRLDNRTARSLWLRTQGLVRAPGPAPEVMEIIRQLGFVQLDTIQTVSRAHHHILWSRNQSYREPMLDRLLRARQVFEHFTHDASVLPMEFLPMWRRQFRRKQEQLDRAGWFKGLPDADARAAIKARIASEGALSTKAFDSKSANPGQMWARPPHKLALDYMWYCGELATCHRKNFTKHYDLAERVFPADLRATRLDESRQIDWLCGAALDRLGFATSGEIQRFWDAVGRVEVLGWVDGQDGLRAVEIETAQGDWLPALAPADIEDRVAALPSPGSRARILNPFDPVIRDRARLQRLFGFDYRNEMFTPAAKRHWGYYVYPILEGLRFTGRIEIKADRRAARLDVLKFWPEPGIRWTAAREERLEAELRRLARLVGAEDIRRAS